MSLFCGIFVLDASAKIPGPWREFLRARLSRAGGGTVSEYVDEHICLFKFDFGGFDAPGWVTDAAHGATALCGDSVIAGRQPSTTRADDVETLNSSSLRDLPVTLRRCRGTYCAAVYKRARPELALATDKLGVRPIYWLSDGRYLLFSGALRLLEDLPDLGLTVDLRGAMEQACFGYPLGDRTPYSQVRSLRGGQLLTCARESGVRVESYWRWDADACARPAASVEEGLANLFERFQEAVALRAGNHRAVFSCLSGGLDSRCVVAQLRVQDIAVHSINVSWAQSADQVLGRLCAQALGTTHHEISPPDAETGSALPGLLSRTMSAHAAAVTSMGGNPRQLWGGNGGSVGLGHVYISPEAMRAIRDRGPRAGAQQYVRDNSLRVASYPLRNPYAAVAQQLPLDTVMEELERLTCVDAGRKLYVFLLENDQRRHHMLHFENIDTVLIEHIDPFFDADVLGAVCSLPLDFCLGHRMYSEWLGRFPPEITKVAWQAYPRHVPCPVPQPPNLSYQWAPKGRALRKRERRDALTGLWFALSNRGSLKSILRPNIVAGAYVALALRLSQAFYIGAQVASISRPLVRCAGRAQLPS